MNEQRRSSRPIWLGEDKRQWDHIRVHLSAVKDPRLGPYHFAVYCALIAHAELQSGDARPSVETIVEYFAGSGHPGDPGGMRDRTARACIANLVAWRYIDVEERPGKASRYKVLRPPTLSADSQTAVSKSGVPAPTPAAHAGVPMHDMPTTLAPHADELEPRNQNHLNDSSEEGGDAKNDVARPVERRGIA